MQIAIDRDRDQPLYHQIASHIRQHIRYGQAPIGTRLPSIRQLASDLGVTRLTVETAYDELRAEGWIETVVGRGTFVARTASQEERINRLSSEVSPRGILEDLQRISDIDVLRSLAYAEPDPALFPVESFWNIIANLKPFAQDLMGYVGAEGDAELRIAISGMLRERGVESGPDDILITTGAAQALTLVTQSLTRRGDVVIVEKPTHITLLHLLEAQGVRPVAIPMDGHGPNLNWLEQAIVQYQPRCFYTIPNFHNPTGTLMSQRRREDLLSLARRYQLTIIEDDIYGWLPFDTPIQEPLKALDDSVIYISSFTKMLMPGLRIGFMSSPQPLHNHLLDLKRSNDLFTAALFQAALTTFIRSGHMRAHLKRVVPHYRQRRDQILRSLKTHMPPGVTWTEPSGGFSLWLTLPSHIDAIWVQRRALRLGFAFTPGSAFFPDNSGSQHLRICFAQQPPDIIEEAISVLANIIKQELYE
ncbi:MAG: PLP-dependent aminotransferase family protein [Chloroflexi bacterium]|nr:PLP-dependent aminotransferase family protein [Chloroflexota bacterium]